MADLISTLEMMRKAADEPAAPAEPATPKGDAAAPASDTASAEPKSDGPTSTAPEASSTPAQKGEERPNHKYTKREALPGGGYRYFYGNEGQEQSVDHTDDSYWEKQGEEAYNASPAPHLLEPYLSTLEGRKLFMSIQRQADRTPEQKTIDLHDAADRLAGKPPPANVTPAATAPAAAPAQTPGITAPGGTPAAEGGQGDAGTAFPDLPVTPENAGQNAEAAAAAVRRAVASEDITAQKQEQDRQQYTGETEAKKSAILQEIEASKARMAAEKPPAPAATNTFDERFTADLDKMQDSFNRELLKIEAMPQARKRAAAALAASPEHQALVQKHKDLREQVKANPGDMKISLEREAVEKQINQARKVAVASHLEDVKRELVDSGQWKPQTLTAPAQAPETSAAPAAAGADGGGSVADPIQRATAQLGARADALRAENAAEREKAAQRISQLSQGRQAPALTEKEQALKDSIAATRLVQEAKKREALAPNAIANFLRPLVGEQPKLKVDPRTGEMSDPTTVLTALQKLRELVGGKGKAPAPSTPPVAALVDARMGDAPSTPAAPASTADTAAQMREAASAPETSSDEQIQQLITEVLGAEPPATPAQEDTGPPAASLGNIEKPEGAQTVSPELPAAMRAADGEQASEGTATPVETQVAAENASAPAAATPEQPEPSIHTTRLETYKNVADSLDRVLRRLTTGSDGSARAALASAAAVLDKHNENEKDGDYAVDGTRDLLRAQEKDKKTGRYLVKPADLKKAAESVRQRLSFAAEAAEREGSETPNEIANRWYAAEEESNKSPADVPAQMREAAGGESAAGEPATTANTAPASSAAPAAVAEEMRGAATDAQAKPSRAELRARLDQLLEQEDEEVPNAGGDGEDDTPPTYAPPEGSNWWEDAALHRDLSDDPHGIAETAAALKEFKSKIDQEKKDLPRGKLKSVAGLSERLAKKAILQHLQEKGFAPRVEDVSGYVEEAMSTLGVEEADEEDDESEGIIVSDVEEKLSNKLTSWLSDLTDELPYNVKDFTESGEVTDRSASHARSTEIESLRAQLDAMDAEDEDGEDAEDDAPLVDTRTPEQKAREEAYRASPAYAEKKAAETARLQAFRDKVNGKAPGAPAASDVAAQMREAAGAPDDSEEDMEAKWDEDGVYTEGYEVARDDRLLAYMAGPDKEKQQALKEKYSALTDKARKHSEEMAEKIVKFPPVTEKNHLEYLTLVANKQIADDVANYNHLGHYVITDALEDEFDKKHPALYANGGTMEGTDWVEAFSPLVDKAKKRWLKDLDGPMRAFVEDGSVSRAGGGEKPTDADVQQITKEVTSTDNPAIPNNEEPAADIGTSSLAHHAADGATPAEARKETVATVGEKATEQGEKQLATRTAEQMRSAIAGEDAEKYLRVTQRDDGKTDLLPKSLTGPRMNHLRVDGDGKMYEVDKASGKEYEIPKEKAQEHLEKVRTLETVGQALDEAKMSSHVSSAVMAGVLASAEGNEKAAREALEGIRAPKAGRLKDLNAKDVALVDEMLDLMDAGVPLHKAAEHLHGEDKASQRLDTETFGDVPQFSTAALKELTGLNAEVWNTPAAERSALEKKHAPRIAELQKQMADEKHAQAGHGDAEWSKAGFPRRPANKDLDPKTIELLQEHAPKGAEQSKPALVAEEMRATAQRKPAAPRGAAAREKAAQLDALVSRAAAVTSPEARAAQGVPHKNEGHEFALRTDDQLALRDALIRAEIQSPREAQEDFANARRILTERGKQGIPLARELYVIGLENVDKIRREKNVAPTPPAPTEVAQQMRDVAGGEKPAAPAAPNKEEALRAVRHSKGDSWSAAHKQLVDQATAAGVSAEELSAAHTDKEYADAAQIGGDYWDEIKDTAEGKAFVAAMKALNEPSGSDDDAVVKAAREAKEAVRAARSGVSEQVKAKRAGAPAAPETPPDTPSASPAAPVAQQLREAAGEEKKADPEAAARAKAHKEMWARIDKTHGKGAKDTLLHQLDVSHLSKEDKKKLKAVADKYGHLIRHIEPEGSDEYSPDMRLHLKPRLDFDGMSTIGASVANSGDIASLESDLASIQERHPYDVINDMVGQATGDYYGNKWWSGKERADGKVDLVPPKEVPGMNTIRVMHDPSDMHHKMFEVDSKTGEERPISLEQAQEHLAKMREAAEKPTPTAPVAQQLREAAGDAPARGRIIPKRAVSDNIDRRALARGEKIALRYELGFMGTRAYFATPQEAEAAAQKLEKQGTRVEMHELQSDGQEAPPEVTAKELPATPAVPRQTQKQKEREEADAKQTEELRQSAAKLGSKEEDHRQWFDDAASAEDIKAAAQPLVERAKAAADEYKGAQLARDIAQGAASEFARAAREWTNGDKVAAREAYVEGLKREASARSTYQTLKGQSTAQQMRAAVTPAPAPTPAEEVPPRLLTSVPDGEAHQDFLKLAATKQARKEAAPTTAEVLANLQAKPAGVPAAPASPPDTPAAPPETPAEDKAKEAARARQAERAMAWRTGNESEDAYRLSTRPPIPPGLQPPAARAWLDKHYGKGKKDTALHETKKLPEDLLKGRAAKKKMAELADKYGHFVKAVWSEPGAFWYELKPGLHDADAGVSSQSFADLDEFEGMLGDVDLQVPYGALPQDKEETAAVPEQMRAAATPVPPPRPAEEVPPRLLTSVPDGSAHQDFLKLVAGATKQEQLATVLADARRSGTVPPAVTEAAKKWWRETNPQPAAAAPAKPAVSSAVEQLRAVSEKAPAVPALTEKPEKPATPVVSSVAQQMREAAMQQTQTGMDPLKNSHLPQQIKTDIASIEDAGVRGVVQHTLEQKDQHPALSGAVSHLAGDTVSVEGLHKALEPLALNEAESKELDVPAIVAEKTKSGRLARLFRGLHKLAQSSERVARDLGETAITTLLFATMSLGFFGHLAHTVVGSDQRKVQQTVQQAQSSAKAGGTPVQQAISAWHMRGGERPKSGETPDDPNRLLEQMAASGGGRTLTESAEPWLRDVYKKVPGGLDRALLEAQSHGSPVTKETLQRPIALQPLGDDDVKHGSTESRTDDVPREVNIHGPTIKDQGDVLAHELTHVINEDTDGKAEEAHPGYAGIVRSDKAMAAIQRAAGGDIEAAENMHNWLDYATQRAEVRAEFLRPIKHWGAARGILPGNPKEARDLIDAYFAAEKPEEKQRLHEPGDEREPYWLQPFIWEDLKNTPNIERELLRTVENKENREVA